MFDNSKVRLIITFAVALLFAGNFFWCFRYYAARKACREAQTALETRKVNERNLEFAKLFIDKVIRARGEIDFETRLKLEETVRKIGDDEILAQWQKFVGSKTSEEAQKEVKELLGMLMEKIQ